MKRIGDVRALRAAQFREDAGPAGASGAAGQLHRDRQFLHRDGLQQGRRGDPHDGHHHRSRGIPPRHGPVFRSATTTRRSRSTISSQAMQDASGVDLARVQAAGITRPARRRSRLPMATIRQRTRYTLTLTATHAADAGAAGQAAAGHSGRDGTAGGDGTELPTRWTAKSRAPARACCCRRGGAELRIRRCAERRRAVAAARLFRAGEAVRHDAGSTAFLAAHDTDPFVRWESGQQYATQFAAGDGGCVATR